MDWLAAYIQPFTQWLQNNPHWSFFITFVVSMSESLAIVGSIIPGSVTMTALGILAGSGVLRIDMTLLAAILGAIAGDSLSYFIGYFYSDRLLVMWPFRKYPHWVHYGKTFFHTHGGKSVILGRFIGPLRSLIPIIAGILRMPQWQFLIANIISAIGWSILYVMPGILIGIAGHELSPKSATKLFLILLIILGALWLLIVFSKFIFIKFHSFLKISLNSQWKKACNQPMTKYLCQSLTPATESNHFNTAMLTIGILSSVCLLVMLLVSIQNYWTDELNNSLHLLLQSLNTRLLEDLFIVINQFTTPLSLAIFVLAFSIGLIIRKEFFALGNYLFLIVSALLVTLFFKQWFIIQRPPGILKILGGTSFPSAELINAIVIWGFALYYFNRQKIANHGTNWLIIISFLLLTGFGELYLGDYWFTDVMGGYLIGVLILFIGILIYRKTTLSKKDAPLRILTILICTAFLASVGISLYLNFDYEVQRHKKIHSEFIINDKIWWNQITPELPIYRLNRIGKKNSFLNIEYCGDLLTFEKELEKKGWKVQKESFLNSLIRLVNSKSQTAKLPLFAQLYNNKPPILILTLILNDPNNSLELRLWESGYTLEKAQKPIWIGSVHPILTTKKQEKLDSDAWMKLVDPQEYFINLSNVFEIKKVEIPKNLQAPTLYSMKPYILLIKTK